MASSDSGNGHDHKRTVREEFTKQADAYATSPAITDQERLGRLVEAVNPSGNKRGIEIATGPGYVAMALAARCRKVVGVDLTEAPLKIAERTRKERGITNTSFRCADAEHLPFADGEFDIAVCRFAFHHFEAPAHVLTEMCRVCTVGGTIAVEDLYSSEIAERAAYYNHFERLRDPSHTRALPLTGLITMFARAGVEIQRLYSDELEAEVESWLAKAQTSAQDAAEVRRLLEADMQRDLSSTQPYVRDARLYFTQRTVALVGRKRWE